MTSDNADDGTHIDTEKMRRYVELTKRKRQTEEDLDGLKKELARLEGQLLEDFERAGVDSMRIDGMTVYPHRQLFANARDGDKERAVEALRACGLDDYVKEQFNTQSLSAYVRELDELEEPLPQPLAEALDVHEKYTLRVRKA